MKEHRLTLCNHRGTGRPVLVLAGKYIEDAGFPIGTRVSVRLVRGELRIRRLPDEEQPYINKGSA